MKIVLAGAPNAGKTTLFNALTKSSLKTGNFHGVTTSPARKMVGGNLFVDVPGMYSFSPYSMEERSAIDEILSADIIINVVDALTLENNLALTKSLIATKQNTIVYVTKTSALKRRGGKCDFNKLSAYLGVPVFGGSPKQLKKYVLQQPSAFKRVANVQNCTFAQAYTAGKTAISKVDLLFYNRFFALIFFICAITLMFFLAFHPSMIGSVLKDKVEFLICDKLCGAITSKMQNAALISLVSEGILGGVGGVLSFIPQLLILYLVLTLLDESGITSALAFTTDGLFEKVHLSGRAAFSLISGFGCTTGAIMTTKGYATKSAQRRTVAILPFIPCGAKLPVFLTFLAPLFKNPFPVITCFYFAGLLTALLISLIIKGGGENMLSEVTPVSIPSFKAVLFKLYFYVKGFIIKVAGAVTLFCVASWLLSHFSFRFEYVEAESSMLAAISRIILPLFYPMGITDWRLAYSAVCGFIAKENIAATIGVLMPGGTGLNLASALAMCTFVLFSPACISAFSASVNEVGLRFTLKCVLFQLAVAFLGGYTVHLLFSL